VIPYRLAGTGTAVELPQITLPRAAVVQAVSVFRGAAAAAGTTSWQLARHRRRCPVPLDLSRWQLLICGGLVGVADPWAGAEVAQSPLSVAKIGVQRPVGRHDSVPLGIDVVHFEHQFQAGGRLPGDTVAGRGGPDRSDLHCAAALRSET
jgi:hypothetical protein